MPSDRALAEEHPAGAAGPAETSSLARLSPVLEAFGHLLLMVAVARFLPVSFHGDPTYFAHVGDLVSFSRHPTLQWLPYRKIFWEYPPLTTPFLALERITPATHAFTLLFGSTQVLLELGALHVVRRAWPELRGPITTLWTLTVLPLAAIAWFRFDFLALFFGTLALASVAGRRGGGPLAIVGGFAAKLWPVILVVPLAAQRRWRAAATAIAGCAVVTALWIAWSPSGFRDFLHYRSSPYQEVEGVVGSLMLFGHHARVRDVGAVVLAQKGISWVTPLLDLALLAIVAFAFLRGRRAGADMVAMSGALILALMLCSWILSAQYVVWVAPAVVVMAAQGHRRIGAWYLAASVLTFTYMLDFGAVDHIGATTTPISEALLIVVRNLVLIAMLVEMLLAIAPRGRSPQATAG